MCFRDARGAGRGGEEGGAGVLRTLEEVVQGALMIHNRSDVFTNVINFRVIAGRSTAMSRGRTFNVSGSRTSEGNG